MKSAVQQLNIITLTGIELLLPASFHPGWFVCLSVSWITKKRYVIYNVICLLLFSSIVLAMVDKKHRDSMQCILVHKVQRPKNVNCLRGGMRSTF